MRHTELLNAPHTHVSTTRLADGRFALNLSEDDEVLVLGTLDDLDAFAQRILIALQRVVRDADDV